MVLTTRKNKKFLTFTKGFTFNCHSEGDSPKNLIKHTKRFFASFHFALNDGRPAFTLAEVLITLTIIGIIAALTIPNLMQSWRKHEKITQIKEAYSIIQNATKMAIAEHGNPDGWDFNGANGYAPTYFVPYVKTSKICGVSTSGTKTKGCFENNNSNGVWYYLNGNEFGWGAYGLTYYYTMILQNGMHVGIWAPGKVVQGSQRNVGFIVDIDGQRGTTTLGKDVFEFVLNLDNGKITTGNTSTTSPITIASTTKANDLITSDCNLNGNGLSCARVIELSGWQFPDNYPVKKW